MDITCIYCKIENLNDNLSDEHIIPEMLGGVFMIRCACGRHNNKFGRTFEGDLKRNAFIVTALDKLKLQPPDKIYRNAKVHIDLDNEKGLKGYIDKNGMAKTFPQDTKNGYQVVPEKQAIDVLKKQIERFEKKVGTKVNFNLCDFDSFPYDIAISIFGTDIVFIKRKTISGNTMLFGLDQPISFRVIAKIALTHLTALCYPFVMKDEFDAIKSYILFGGENRFVMLHTLLRDKDPKTINYLPYHYIRLKFINGALVAIVGLFGTIKFMVYFATVSNIDEFKPLEVLDNYHVYDINNKNIFPSTGDNELRKWDDMLLETVVDWAKH